MSSLAFDFGPKDRADRAYRALVRAVNDAVDVLQLEVAAGACDVAKGDMRAMLDGRNGRRLSTEIAAIIAERVGHGQYRDAILDAIRELFGLHQPESDPLYIHRVERALLGFGKHGEIALAQCRKEARRA